MERELELPFFVWSRSRPNLVGAGVGSGTSDFPIRSHPKKWRLRNTVRKYHILFLIFFAFNGCICVGWSCIVWATPWPLPGDPGSHPQWCQGRAANHHFSFGRFVFGPLNSGWFKSNSRYWSMTDSTLYAWCADPALKSRNYLIPAKVFPVFRLHFCSGSGLA